MSQSEGVRLKMNLRGGRGGGGVRLRMNVSIQGCAYVGWRDGLSCTAE